MVALLEYILQREGISPARSNVGYTTVFSDVDIIIITTKIL